MENSDIGKFYGQADDTFRENGSSSELITYQRTLDLEMAERQSRTGIADEWLLERIEKLRKEIGDLSRDKLYKDLGKIADIEI